MKIKKYFFAYVAWSIFFTEADAASFICSNLVDGQTDRLFADSAGVPLKSGVAALGVFPTGFAVTTNLSFMILIENFVVFNSGMIGGMSPSLGGEYPGYIENSFINNFLIFPGNPLIDRPLYAFIGNGTLLATSTAFALYQIGTLREDLPTDQDYFLTTMIGQPIFGTIGVSAPIAYDFNGGNSFQYPTLNLVPEPSTLLMCVFGSVCLFRRGRAAGLSNG